MRIMLIEDSLPTARIISRALESEGHIVEWDYELMRGLETYEYGRFDILISDLHLSDISDYEIVYQELKRVGCHIIISGYDTGYDDVIIKDEMIGEKILGLINAL